LKPRLLLAFLCACGSGIDLGDRVRAQAEAGAEPLPRAPTPASSTDASVEAPPNDAQNTRDSGAPAGADVASCGRAKGAPCRVFVTDARTRADFGGFAGGDARCAVAARGARLSGRFKVFVSDGHVPAWSRFVSDGPWQLVGSGETIFSDARDLAIEGPRTLDRNERGERMAITGHWTGAREQGFAGEACGGFASLDKKLNGSSGNTAPSRWLYQAYHSCDIEIGFHLLCLED
jgi:hypothetical protein